MFTDFATIDRELPNCIDIEQMILGQLLLDAQIVPIITGMLDTSHFYSHQNRVIYDAIATLSAKNIGISPPTVSQYLIDKGHSEGETRYNLSVLVEKVVSSANCIEFASSIKEKYQLRQIIAIGNKMISDAYESAESGEVIDQYSTELIKIRQDNVQNRVKAISELVPQVYEELANEDFGQFIPIGFTEIDAITGGMPRNALTVVGGRGGMGKSTFGINVALRRAEQGDTVLYFALEMSNSQMVRKSIANVANKDTGKLFVGKLFRPDGLDDQRDWEYIAAAGKDLTGLDLWLQDDPSITIARIRADIQEVLVRQGKIDLVVIDYVQLIQPDKYDRRQNRVLELDSILRSLRIMAKDYQCAVMGLAQLSRAAEGRADKRPMPSDFRESGAFEQEASVMLGLYREEYYDPQTTEKGILELSALKSRFSRSGNTTKILFDSEYGVFRDNTTHQFSH